MDGELKRRRKRMSNTAIVVCKIITACVFLFVTCMFFFSNMDVLWADLGRGNPFPIIFIAGLLCVAAYIIYLIFRVADESAFRAERLDLAYKIVFSFVLVFVAVRSIFIEPYLTMPIGLVIVAIVSGLFNWLIPPVVTNDEDF